jgi:hypothetical protein
MIEARERKTLRIQGLGGSGERSGFEKNVADLGKGKTTQSQARTGPEGSRRLRHPDFGT